MGAGGDTILREDVGPAGAGPHPPLPQVKVQRQPRLGPECMAMIHRFQLRIAEVGHAELSPRRREEEEAFAPSTPLRPPVHIAAVSRGLGGKVGFREGFKGRAVASEGARETPIPVIFPGATAQVGGLIKALRHGAAHPHPRHVGQRLFQHEPLLKNEPARGRGIAALRIGQGKPRAGAQESFTQHPITSPLHGLEPRGEGSQPLPSPAAKGPLGNAAAGDAVIVHGGAPQRGGERRQPGGALAPAQGFKSAGHAVKARRESVLQNQRWAPGTVFPGSARHPG